MSTFSHLAPNVLGLFVSVFGRNNTMRLSNNSGKTVVVLGRSNEPYLRFAPEGVEENLRSPSTFLNKSLRVPATANPNARPRWRKIADGTSYAWHDHRIVWTGIRPPLVVKQAPHVSHLIFRWAIHARANGKPFLIRGFLGWAPPPSKATGGKRTWLYSAVGAGAIAALATLALGLRARRPGRRAL